MADDISTADMARLLLGMSATSPQGLTDPGMAVMSPLARKPDKGQIPYNTTVENGPTPMERFVGSLGQFKDQALDLMPMTAIPRHAARTYHAYDQGDTTEAGLRTLQMATLMAMPAAGAMKSAAGTLPGASMMGLMGTQPGAKLSGEVALRNFRSGAQMPEHASRIAARLMSSGATPSPSRASDSSGGVVMNDPIRATIPGTFAYERAQYRPPDMDEIRGRLSPAEFQKYLELTGRASIMSRPAKGAFRVIDGGKVE